MMEASCSAAPRLMQRFRGANRRVKTVRNPAFWFISLVTLLAGSTATTCLAQNMTTDAMHLKLSEHICNEGDPTYKEISYRDHCGLMKDEGGSLTNGEYWNCQRSVDRQNEVIQKWNDHVMKCRQGEQRRR